MQKYINTKYSQYLTILSSYWTLDVVLIDHVTCYIHLSNIHYQSIANSTRSKTLMNLFFGDFFYFEKNGKILPNAEYRDRPINLLLVTSTFLLEHSQIYRPIPIFGIRKRNTINICYLYLIKYLFQIVIKAQFLFIFGYFFF